MYCSSCGQANADDAAFCSRCGARLTPAVAGTPATPIAATTTFAGSAPPTDAGFDEAAWRLAIGKNVDYYLPRFRIRHGSRMSATSWHWPTLFITFYWLLYRKLWVWALGYFLLPIGVSLAIGVLAAIAGTPGGSLAGWLMFAFWIVLLIGPPLYANELYYRHCAALIREQLRRGTTREAGLAYIEARGGTSWIVLIVVAVLGFVPLVGILAAIALPAYQDYMKRAKSSEAIVEAMQVARQVGDYAERTGSMPEDLQQFPLPAGSRFVSGLQLDPKTGVITVGVVFTPSPGGGSIFLIPKTGPDHR